MGLIYTEFHKGHSLMLNHGFACSFTGYSLNTLVASTVQLPDINQPRERMWDLPSQTLQSKQRQQSLNQQENNVYKVQVESLLEGKSIGDVGETNEGLCRASDGRNAGRP